MQQKDLLIQQSEDTICRLNEQQEKLTSSKQFMENTQEINIQLRNDLLLAQQQAKSEKKTFESMIESIRRENQ